MNSHNYIFSGTLGDAFIVACKLHSIKSLKLVRVRRISRWTNMDTLIKDMFDLFDGIEYEIPCEKFENESDRIHKIKYSNRKYIDVSWDNSDKRVPSEINENLEMQPFPNLKIDVFHKKHASKVIGLQVNSGKKGGNYKHFDFETVQKLVKLVTGQGWQLKIFGTDLNIGNKIELMSRGNTNISNYIGKASFKQWLSELKQVDFFITPEGFPAFFAMSQKIRTIVFYNDIEVLKRIHPQWKNYSILYFYGSSNIYLRFINFLRRVFRLDQNKIRDSKNEIIFEKIFNHIKIDFKI